MAHHAALPIALVVDEEVSDAAKITAAWLCSFANTTGTGRVSLGTIALLMGVEERQAQKKFKELVDRGHVVKKKASRNEFGEWVRGFQFIYPKTSLRDVIADRKAALRDVLHDPKSVLPAQQKRPLRVKKTSSEAAPLEHRIEHRIEQKKERGSRLPSDAVLRNDWKSWAMEARPDLDPDTVFANFKDYWIATPGAKGRKADWLATWRTWVRRERKNGEYRSGKTSNGNGFAELVAGGFAESSLDELQPSSLDPGDVAGGSNRSA